MENLTQNHHREIHIRPQATKRDGEGLIFHITLYLLT